jgi:hypothetical protein
MNKTFDKQAQARLAQQVLMVAAVAVFALTVDHSLAAAGIVTKMSQFCSQWIKLLYLGIIGIGVFITCAKGAIEIVNEEGNGGRKIMVGLVGGGAGILIPAAILAAVGATGFTCA